MSGIKRRSELTAAERAYLAEHFGFAIGVEGRVVEQERDGETGEQERGSGGRESGAAEQKCAGENSGAAERERGAPALTASDLLDRAVCAAFLDAMVEDGRAPSRLIAASLFAKRYAYLSLGPVLYAMSKLGKGLELKPGHTFLLEQPSLGTGGAWLPGLRLAGIGVTMPEPGHRETWRQELTELLFAGHLAPLWRSLHEASRVPMAILWENAAVRLFSLYEKRLEKEASAEERERIAADYEELVLRAPGQLFGERSNPFERFHGGSSAAPSVLRLRKTCCLYYRANVKGSYCTACPKPEVSRVSHR